MGAGELFFALHSTNCFFRNVQSFADFTFETCECIFKAIQEITVYKKSVLKFLLFSCAKYGTVPFSIQEIQVPECFVNPNFIPQT